MNAMTMNPLKARCRYSHQIRITDCPTLAPAHPRLAKHPLYCTPHLNPHVTVPYKTISMQGSGTRHL